MPELVRLPTCKICVYAGDHRPPHFHIRGPDARAAIEIATLRLLKGRCSRAAFDEAVKWANQAENMERLLAEWRRLNERD